MASEESVRRWDIEVDVTGDVDIRPHITEAVTVLVGRLITAGIACEVNTFDGDGDAFDMRDTHHLVDQRPDENREADPGEDPIGWTLDTLYQHAKADAEVTALDTLTERAGLIWTCAADKCTGYRNQSNAHTCGGCGTPRPEPPHQAGDKP